MESERPLWKILEDLTTAEQAAEFFGKVNATAEADIAALKAKVDACILKIEEWECEAAGWNGQADYYEAKSDAALFKSQALLNKSNNLRSYIALTMRANNFDRLPGLEYAISLKRSNNPKTIVGIGADASAYTKYPGMVRMIPRSYAWDLDAIKADLKKAEKEGKPSPLKDFARLEYKYSVDFETPALVAAKRKVKPKNEEK